ncbi:MAG: NADP-specific glutamate dehydrogenase [Natronohydrobacter sp.]|nr:NADP-specific glutamate dehydrogenase [Natronohydrobacter sp.]
MKDRAETLLSGFMNQIAPRHPGEAEFLQAVEDVARDVLTIEKASSDFTASRVLERLSEADRIISFRITWRDDSGDVQINRGWRVQQTNLLGPYKGGVRWAPEVTTSVLKFLAFEQAFKNALTGMPLGAAKGGADFQPKGRSVAEIERFAAAFMAELSHHVGPELDVPAGDIGVGAQEIGLMSRAWMQQARRWGGAMTGKPTALAGSAMRAEATGYGLIYLTEAVLTEVGEALAGKRVAISGRGNVSRHAARKALTLGAKVITLSGRAGTWHAPDGFTHETLDQVLASTGDDVHSPSKDRQVEFHADTKPWRFAPDIALPCATQNELTLDDAQALVESGCCYLAEGANMPLTAEAGACFAKSGLVQVPGKAANAGGVAVSGLEMQQNAGFAAWNADKVDRKLRAIMCDIHDLLKRERTSCCTMTGAIDYRRAANVAGYRRLAQAMVAGGVL